MVRSFFFFFRINFEFRTDFQSVDIQIQFSEEGKRHLYSITSINGRQLRRPVQNTHSPIAPIKLTGGAAHDAAKIPENATHYCWLNGSGISGGDATYAAANEALMLLLGALAYLDVDESGNYSVIQINRFHRSDNGRLQFIEPTKWQNEYTQSLFDQDRFAVGFN